MREPYAWSLHIRYCEVLHFFLSNRIVVSLRIPFLTHYARSRWNRPSRESCWNRLWSCPTSPMQIFSFLSKRRKDVNGLEIGDSRYSWLTHLLRINTVFLCRLVKTVSYTYAESPTMMTWSSFLLFSATGRVSELWSSSMPWRHWVRNRSFEAAHSRQTLPSFSQPRCPFPASTAVSTEGGKLRRSRLLILLIWILSGLRTCVKE